MLARSVAEPTKWTDLSEEAPAPSTEPSSADWRVGEPCRCGSKARSNERWHRRRIEAVRPESVDAIADVGRVRSPLDVATRGKRHERPDVGEDAIERGRTGLRESPAQLRGNDFLVAAKEVGRRRSAGASGRRRSKLPTSRRAIHDLRHTAVSLWIADGANPKQIAVMAGHTSVSVVLDHYGHLYPQQEEELMDRLERRVATRS